MPYSAGRSLIPYIIGLDNMVVFILTIAEITLQHPPTFLHLFPRLMIWTEAAIVFCLHFQVISKSEWRIKRANWRLKLSEPGALHRSLAPSLPLVRKSRTHVDWALLGYVYFNVHVELHALLYIHAVLRAARREHWTFWNRSYSCCELWATLWVLGTDPGSSAEGVCAVNYWAISPVPG